MIPLFLQSVDQSLYQNRI